MRKPTAIGAGAVGAGLLIALFGQGTAAAFPDVSGETYGIAKRQFAQEGLTPVVVSRVGDRADEDDCTVQRVQDANYLNGTGGARSGRVYVHLNCYASVADTDSPGYSQRNPMGKKVQQNGS